MAHFCKNCGLLTAPYDERCPKCGAPLPHIPLMATGGVNPNTIPQFLSAGISACGTGITVLKKNFIANCNYEAIRDLAKMHKEAVRLWQKENEK